MKRSLFVLSFALILSACGSEDQGKSDAAQAAGCNVTPKATREVKSENILAAASSRFIVKFSAKAGVSSRGARIARSQRISAKLAKGSDISELGEDLSLIKLPAQSNASELVQQLGMSGEEIEYIEPDAKVHATFAPNDPKLSSQWAHAIVNSAAAWDISRGSSSVIVAVLDSGLDYTHPDLAANVWNNPGEIAGNGLDDDHDGFIDDVHGWNFVSNNNKPIADDSAFHGTHVAGTIGAVGNNGIGVSGHAPNVKLMALKFLGNDGSGYTSDAVKGVNYAVDHHANIINNSWGGSSRSQALSDAIDRARAAGILFVVAAGNEGSNNDQVNSYPTNYPQDNIVRVAASDINDKLASWSNYGAKKVDLAAPGVNIYSTKNGNSYQYLSGTSMATPLVSGVLATMIAARPDLSYKQIKGALLSTVDVKSSFKGKVAWNGRVNAGRALQKVTSLDANTETPEPPPTEPSDPAAPSANCE
ncbi:MAG: S8 family peptidase [Bdellovibrionota bacterium]